MNPYAILVALGFLLLTNAVIIYFTFSTWYGQKKQKRMISYTIDEKGNLKFDLGEVDKW